MRDTNGHTLYDSIYIKMSRLGKSTVEHHWWWTETKRAEESRELRTVSAGSLWGWGTTPMKESNMCTL